jgi:hypothetical protein
MLAITEQMVHHLQHRGYNHQQLLWRPDVHAGHNERAWRRRLPKAFRFMFRA